MLQHWICPAGWQSPGRCRGGVHGRTEVGDGFLQVCYRLQGVDMGHTALQTIGHGFADCCAELETVVLPDTVTEVGMAFLCTTYLPKGSSLSKSGSPAVRAAIRKKNALSIRIKPKKVLPIDEY